MCPLQQGRGPQKDSVVPRKDTSESKKSRNEIWEDVNLFLEEWEMFAQIQERSQLYLCHHEQRRTQDASDFSIESRIPTWTMRNLSDFVRLINSDIHFLLLKYKS